MGKFSKGRGSFSIVKSILFSGFLLFPETLRVGESLVDSFSLAFPFSILTMGDESPNDFVGLCLELGVDFNWTED